MLTDRAPIIPRSAFDWCDEKHTRAKALGGRASTGAYQDEAHLPAPVIHAFLIDADEHVVEQTWFIGRWYDLDANSASPGDDETGETFAEHLAHQRVEMVAAGYPVRERHAD